MRNKTEEQFTDVLMAMALAAIFGLAVGAGLGFLSTVILP